MIYRPGRTNPIRTQRDYSGPYSFAFNQLSEALLDEDAMPWEVFTWI